MWTLLIDTREFRLAVTQLAVTALGLTALALIPAMRGSLDDLAAVLALLLLAYGFKIAVDLAIVIVAVRRRSATWPATPAAAGRAADCRSAASAAPTDPAPAALPPGRRSIAAPES
jgi:hypothetical protein